MRETSSSSTDDRCAHEVRCWGLRAGTRRRGCNAGSIAINSNRFDVEPELTAKIGRLEARVDEVPISYAGRDAAEGKKVSWRDGFWALWAIFRFRFFD